MTRKNTETFADFSAAHFKLWKKCEVINQLSQLLQNYLESNWQQHCKVANFREEILIISVANSALATQLRFQSANVLTFFQRHNIHFKKIELIIDNNFWRTQQKQQKTEKLELSTSSKTVFKSVAKTLKNERLKKAIESFVE